MANMYGQDDFPGDDDTSVGVRYITEDLIKKVAKQEHIEIIINLNLTLSKEGAKKIKFIENLDRLKKCTILNLSCNIIEKMERLDKLTKLRELNVAYNRITKIEGIETLTGLQILIVTGNQIEHIPVFLGKKLKNLRTFKVAKNHIQSLSEFTKLRPLKDLTQLTVAENPVSQLPHCRQYLLFHIRTLESLDGQHITLQERATASKRFAQEEIEKLEHSLAQESTKYDKLKEEHNRSLQEIEEKEKKHKEHLERLKNYNLKMKTLERELETKTGLLKRKTAELTKACEKHYELEQELAFYKIDDKFGALREKPPVHVTDSESVDEDGLIGEATYIGKGLFKKNQRVYSTPGTRSQGGVSLQGSLNASGGQQPDVLDPQVRQMLHAQLDGELNEKREAIDRSHERLKKLQDELLLTESQLAQATGELQKIAEVGSPDRHLTEDDKQLIRGRLGDKIDRVHHLRGEAENLEHDLQDTNQEIIDQERDLGRLKGQLRRMGSQDSLFSEVQREVAYKEEELDERTNEYNNLQGQLQNMLQTIAKETGDIGKLETDLREGQVSQNDEIKNELQGIIDGLQTYLSDVKHKADQQKHDYDKLLIDKEELAARLEGAEADRSYIEAQASEISLLKEEIAKLEENMGDIQDANQSLKAKLDDTRIKEAEDEELYGALKEVEEDLDKTRHEKEQVERKARQRLDDMERQIAEEKRKFGLLKNKVRDVDKKNDEINILENQLKALQEANTRLQDQLFAQQQRLLEEKKKNIDPGDLRKRLDDVTQAIRTGKTKPKSKDQKDAETDVMDTALGDLQEKLQNEMDKSFKDVDKALKAKESAEAEVRRMRDAITQAQEAEKEKADKAIEALMREERRERKALMDEIDRLRQELEKEKRSNLEKPIPVHLLEPTSRTAKQSTTTATTSGASTTSGVTTSSETEETIPSSQWSVKKNDLYESMTQEEQELFDELQGEIDLLKRLLSMKDKDAAKKVADRIEQKVQTLGEMMERNRSESRPSSGYSSHRDRHGERVNKSTTGALAKEDPRLKQAAEDLARAQEEIEDLQKALKRKTGKLKDEKNKSEKSENAMTMQQDEINTLYDVLEDQRSEISKLNDVIGNLTGHGPDYLSRHEDELRQVQRGAAELQRSLGPHRTQVYSLAGSRRGQHEAPFDRSPHKRDGHHDRSRRDHHDVPYERSGRDQYDHDRRRSRSQGPHGDYNDGATPRGRPVPTFYGPDGQPTSQPYTQPREGHHPPPHPAYSAPHTAPPAGPPQYPPTHGAHIPHHHPQPGVNMIPHGVPPQGGAPQQGYSGQPQHTAPPGYAASQGYPTVGGAQAPRVSGIQHPGSVGIPAGGVVNPLQQQAVPPGTMFVQGPQGTVMTAQTMQGQGTVIGGIPSQPTTPIAGHAMGRVVSAPTTPVHLQSQPMMMSTPVAVADGSPLKSILKKGDQDLDDGLFCNIVEHHDLEDYIDKLQAKVRQLKSRLKQKGESSSMINLEDSKRVLFEDDVDKTTIKRLQAELNERRHELESLDLDIERQKSQLKDMKDAEGKMRAHKAAMREELEELKMGRVSGARRRRAFLAGGGDYTPYEDDYDYDYQPRGGRSRPGYVQEEIVCLEETLAKRRAELREADRLLMECEADLCDAKREASQTIQQYSQAKEGLKSSIRDVQEIEKRTHEAGVTLIKTEEKLVEAKLDLEEVESDKREQQKLLNGILQVISEKDLEFRAIDQKIKESMLGYQKMQTTLQEAEHQQREKLEMMEESERVTSDRRRELTALREQIESERKELDLLNREMARERNEIETLRITIQKRSSQLDLLDRDVDSAIDSKRNDMKSIEENIQGLQDEWRHLQDELRDKRQSLQQVRQKIQDEEDVLSSLATTTNQQKTSLKDVDLRIQDRNREIESLGIQLERSRSNVTLVQAQVEEEEKTSQRLRAENHKYVSEIEALKQQIEREKGELEILGGKRKGAESTIDRLQREKGDVENRFKESQAKISELKGIQTRLEETIKRHQGKLKSIDQALRGVERAVVSDSKTLKSVLKSDQRSDTDSVRSSIPSSEEGQYEGDVGVQSKKGTLEVRVRDLGKEIKKRDNEKVELAQALDRSYSELQNLRKQAARDYGQLKEKSSREIADLEGIAQAHYSRAHRLADELNYMRAEYMEARRQVDNLRNLEERDKELDEKLNDIKCDITFDVKEGIHDLEKSLYETTTNKPADDREDIEKHIGDLKNNLNKVKGNKSDTELTKCSEKRSFVEQQELLKKQLAAQMNRHTENMKSSRQRSMNDINKLQKKLNDLENVLSQGDSLSARQALEEDFLALVGEPTKLSRTPDPSSTSSLSLGMYLKETPVLSQKSASSGSVDNSAASKSLPKRAYSPHRHSHSRRSRSRSNTPVRDETVK